MKGEDRLPDGESDVGDPRVVHRNRAAANGNLSITRTAETTDRDGSLWKRSIINVYRLARTISEGETHDEQLFIIFRVRRNLTFQENISSRTYLQRTQLENNMYIYIVFKCITEIFQKTINEL